MTGDSHRATVPRDKGRPLRDADRDDLIDEVWGVLGNATTDGLAEAFERRLLTGARPSFERIITARWAQLVAAPPELGELRTRLTALRSAVDRALVATASGADVDDIPEPWARPRLYRGVDGDRFHVKTCRWWRPTMTEWAYRPDLALDELVQHLVDASREAGLRLVQPCRFCLADHQPEMPEVSA